jgi:hypothetical protein
LKYILSAREELRTKEENRLLLKEARKMFEGFRTSDFPLYEKMNRQPEQ